MAGGAPVQGKERSNGRKRRWKRVNSTSADADACESCPFFQHPTTLATSSCLPSLIVSPFPLVLLPPRGKNRRDPLNETDWLHRPDKRSIELRREIQPPRFSCLWKGMDTVVERERRRTYKCCCYIELKIIEG